MSLGARSPLLRLTGGLKVRIPLGELSATGSNSGPSELTRTAGRESLRPSHVSAIFSRTFARSARPCRHSDVRRLQSDSGCNCMGCGRTPITTSVDLSHLARRVFPRRTGRRGTARVLAIPPDPIDDSPLGQSVAVPSASGYARRWAPVDPSHPVTVPRPS